MGALQLPIPGTVTPDWHGMAEFGVVGLLVLIIIVRLILRG
jgi:hypothetical protein